MSEYFNRTKKQGSDRAWVARTWLPPEHIRVRRSAKSNMSAVTKAVAIVVSESSVVRPFCHGQLVGEIIPEVWMMDHAAHLCVVNLEENASSPFPQLFPDLDKRLHLPGTRNAAVDQSAILICLLIEIPNSGQVRCARL
jgi:hypothetical protein